LKRILVLLLAVFLLPIGSSCKKASEKEVLLQIYALDVGQGDSFLLRTAEGDILIDAGTESSQELLCLRLEQLGVTKLRLAVFTHPDEDHIGGADGVLQGFEAEEVWINGAGSEEECFTALLDAAKTIGVAPRAVQAGDAMEIGGVVFFVLSPFGGETESGNADSIVLKITCGEVSAAVLSGSGKIYTGVCIDTCSTLGICAERNAIFNMITNGENEIDKVLCILPDGKSGAPCGACRELMVQLMPGKYYGIEIMMDMETERIMTLGELTPEWWIK
jgi:cytidine deaminase